VTSARQRDANRRNARSSTGPRTHAGKARAAQNARRHGLSLPTRYDPSRCDEVEALARAIAGADVDAECLELARRIAEAQIDIIRARSARWQLFPEALRERDGIVRLAATDRYERRAWLRRKRAIREFDDARSIERVGDFADDLAERSHGHLAERSWAHLAERSQLRKAEQPACVAPVRRTAGGSEEGRAAADAPSGKLAERNQCELAERSQPETFASKPSVWDFGRTKPMAAVTIASSGTAGRSILRLRPCHRDGKGSRSPPLNRRVWLCLSQKSPETGMYRARSARRSVAKSCLRLL
jgi:hypothetical protein